MDLRHEIGARVVPSIRFRVLYADCLLLDPEPGLLTGEVVEIQHKFRPNQVGLPVEAAPSPASPKDVSTELGKSTIARTDRIRPKRVGSLEVMVRGAGIEPAQSLRTEGF